jgi:DNA polymerase-3 subunit alpha
VARSLRIGGDRSTAFKIANNVTADIPDTVTENDKIIKVDSMARALKYSKKLQSFVHEYPEILDYANHLIGLPRTFSTHAAGVIIADLPLDTYVPLRRDNAGQISIQFDKDVCEYFKLVKYDFLALETLDVMTEVQSLAVGLGQTLPAPDDIPEDDPHTYKLIQSGNVVGVFQLSGSLAPLCKALRPVNITDIALVNALGRPSCSPAERIDFINRRFERTRIKYLHKCLEPVLKHTYGIGVFDDDLLKIAQHVGGWDLSEADGLRKMTKAKEKGADMQAILEKKFVGSAQTHSGLTMQESKQIWEEVIVPFAKYGFPASHAILYSMISYQTAYYKTHSPGPFFCASLNSETRGNKKDRQESIDTLRRDAKKFKVSLNPCDINISKQYYTLKDSSTIVMGLGAIKGVGDKALDAIIGNQPYASFEDFLHRTPSRTVSKDIIIALAKAGAFDSVGVSRQFAAEHYALLRKALLAYVRSLGDEWFEGGDISKPLPGYLDNFKYKNIAQNSLDWNLREKLTNEKEVLGEYISGSAEDIFPKFFRGGVYAQPFSKVAHLPENTSFAMEGLIVSIREIVIKKAGRNQGKIMAKFLVENLRGEAIETTIWADTYNQLKKYFKVGIPIRGMFKVNEFNGSKSLILVKIEDIYKEPKGEMS